MATTRGEGHTGTHLAGFGNGSYVFSWKKLTQNSDLLSSKLVISGTQPFDSNLCISHFLSKQLDMRQTPRKLQCALRADPGQTP